MYYLPPRYDFREAQAVAKKLAQISPKEEIKVIDKTKADDSSTPPVTTKATTPSGAETSGECVIHVCTL